RYWTLQKAPTKPANEIKSRIVPTTMSGQRRTLTHSASSLVASQMPVPIIGNDNIIATKFSAPVMLLLTAIFVGMKGSYENCI
ncbi:hypothetical protein AB723_19640, partial [Acinetobacter baumannii]